MAAGDDDAADALGLGGSLVIAVLVPPPEKTLGGI